MNQIGATNFNLVSKETKMLLMTTVKQQSKLVSGYETLPCKWRHAYKWIYSVAFTCPGNIC